MVEDFYTWAACKTCVTGIAERRPQSLGQNLMVAAKSADAEQLLRLAVGYVLRPHRMHEMRTIATDGPVVSSDVP